MDRREADGSLEPEPSSGGAPPCPFCGWQDPNCGHLLVAADRTYLEFLGRHFDEQVEPAVDLLVQAVGPGLARVGRLAPEERDRLLARVDPPRLRALLVDTLAEWPELPEDGDAIAPGDRALWDYLEEILLSSADTIALAWEFHGRPGERSAMVDFWSSNPAHAAREARRLLREDVVALDRLLPQR